MSRQNQTKTMKPGKKIINTATKGSPRDEAQKERMTVCNILSSHSELCVMMLKINKNLEKTTISTFAEGSFECMPLNV